LINELDQPLIEQIQGDLEQKEFYPQIQEFREQNQLPIPNDEFNLPRLIAIREDEEYELRRETLLIGENEIDGEPNLPRPN